ncbi:phosphotransferase [Phocaeicola plebeius]|uniref:phosphotransferase n=1 Tax=Phocaeicola plebeius TaxID=310297 RepID=UPI0026EF6E63|nr:phosphotransferase [Phocaeicola plebeius]
MEIEVKGHSGCSVNIVREGKKLIIVKGTNDPKYVSRLEKQALKQKEVSKIEYQFVRIPHIYSIEKSSSSLLIKMEYIYSKNYIEHFEAAGFEQVEYFINAMKLFLEKEISFSPTQTISRLIIEKKFEDVKQKINSNPLLKNDSIINSILFQSNNIFKNLPKEIFLPVGRCHGDLTFSNILFNGNNCYLIDFLDSFIESPIMDMVKLRQDSAYRWSTLMYNGTYDETRLKIVSQKIDKELTAYFSDYDWYKSYYKPFQIMNFLRILQYAKEIKIIDYLKTILIELLKNTTYEFNNTCSCR